MNQGLFQQPLHVLKRRIEWEEQTGYTFRQDISLQEIARLAQQPIRPQLTLF